VIVDRLGHAFLEMIPGEESELLTCYSPVTASMVLAKFRGNIVIGYNQFREQWEAPAGRIEDGETPRDCARRELLEESCQSAGHLDFVGLAHIRRASGGLKYTAVYSTSLPSVAGFEPNLEWSQIKLWDLRQAIEPMDQADAAIIRTCTSIGR